MLSRVVAFVAAGLPQVHARHVRGVHQRVAALQVLVAHPVFHLLADEAALGMPEDQPRPRQLLDGEQVELLAQHAMVALLRLLDLVQILVEVLLAEERGAVDALQLRVLLVAQPVRARDVEHLECLDAPGGRDVRPAAEVGELAGLVDGNLLVGRGELLDEVALHEVAFRLEALQALLARQKLARVGQVLLHQLLHLLLDGFQVLGRERLLAIEVVEESALGRRTVAELGLGKQLQHRGGHQVRRRVAIDFQRFGIAVSEDAQLGILLQRTGEVHGWALFLRRLGCRRPSTAGLCPFPPLPFGDSGLICAASAASARRGLMLLAMSSAEVPRGTSFTLPSGNFTCMFSAMMTILFAAYIVAPRCRYKS